MQQIDVAKKEEEYYERLSIKDTGSQGKGPQGGIANTELPSEQHYQQVREGFHILELHIPMLGNGVGLHMTVIIIAVVLLVYRKHRKWLSEVKRL